jgi:hypothetical protein
MSLKRMTGFFSNSRSGILRGVLLEGVVKGPDGKREWISGYSPDYQRALVPARENLELRNSVIHVDARNWVVDRASGEVSWIGAIHG